MDYVNLGKTGLKVSRICLGCMSYGAPAQGEPTPGTMPGLSMKRRASLFFARRSISASTSSTPPTSTRAARAKRLPDDF